MKAKSILLSFLVTGQIFASGVSFFCPDSGSSNFWRNGDVAWSLQHQGWHEDDSWHYQVQRPYNPWESAIYPTAQAYHLGQKYGAGRLYWHDYANLQDACTAHTELLKGNFKYCIDISTEVLNHEAKLAVEKKKADKEARLKAIELAVGEMKKVTDEINSAYKELIEMYKNPQINPGYKQAIEALTKRIQALEEYKKTLEQTITP